MVSKRFERVVTLRYLLPGRREAFVALVAAFSLVAVMLGVAALIVVMSVMNGFRADLMERISGLNGHAIIKSRSGDLESWRSLVEMASRTPGVTVSTPVVEQALFVSMDGRVQPATVRGMRPIDIFGRAGFQGKEVIGSFHSLAEGKDNIAIGSRLAESLGATFGTKVTIFSPKTGAPSEGTPFRSASYTVAAIFEVGVYDIDNTYVVMPLTNSQILLEIGDKVDSIELMVSDPENVGEILAPIKSRLSSKTSMLDWRQMNSQLFSALTVDRIVSFAVLCIILLVAAFNMASSLIMLVRSKKRDIAVLRTMGATQSAIMRIFLAVGMAIGAAGMVLGGALGGLFLSYRDRLAAIFAGEGRAGAQLALLSQLPSRTSYWEVVGICLMTLLFCFIATLYPAWQASQIDPVEVLRYE